jgi:hypothetical protein
MDGEGSTSGRGSVDTSRMTSTGVCAWGFLAATAMILRSFRISALSSFSSTRRHPGNERTRRQVRRHRYGTSPSGSKVPTQRWHRTVACGAGRGGGSLRAHEQ